MENQAKDLTISIHDYFFRGLVKRLPRTYKRRSYRISCIFENLAWYSFGVNPVRRLKVLLK